MSYVKRSRKENSTKYFIAGLLDSIMVLSGMLLLMISVSAVDFAEDLSIPLSWGLVGIFLAGFAIRNIIIMEGGDDDEET